MAKVGTGPRPAAATSHRMTKHHSVLLAGTTGLVVAVLIYAGVTIRRQMADNESLRAELADFEQQRQVFAGARDRESDLDARLREERNKKELLERTLTETQKQLTKTKEAGKAREAELQKVVDFLREEIKSAEAIIQGLKAAPAPPKKS